MIPTPMALSLWLSMCRSAAAGPHVIAEQELVRGEGSKAWQGKAWQGMAGKGVESNAGREGTGKQGKATRLGNKARQGKARQGRAARQGNKAGQGKAMQGSCIAHIDSVICLVDGLSYHQAWSW